MRILDEQLYNKIPVNHLILFAIHLVSDEKKDCSFEKLTEKCFTLFPRVFYLQGYSKWPDTRKLDRPLRTLRKRKLITGNPQASFSLTKKGKNIAQEIAKLFSQTKLL